MTAVLAQWRASYAPGEWIALTGPTSLVVLLPSAMGWTPLLDSLWEGVLQSTSLTELAGELSKHGLEAMPSFGAFFWTPEGMRSLVRGDVVVRNVHDGAVVANGRGIQTWSEIGLGHLDCIRVETPGGAASPGLQLPFVVGAALVSSITLDARSDVSVPAVDEREADLGAAEHQAGLAAMSASDRATMEADTQLWGQSVPPLPADADQMATTAPLLVPPSARVVISDGTVVELTHPVRIGRAPTGHGAPEDVLLVTVRSPQQDISRTHLEVVLDNGQVVATDLHSTNGTWVSRPGASSAPERLPAAVGVPLPMGSELDIGDNVVVRIEPSSPVEEHSIRGDH